MDSHSPICEVPVFAPRYRVARQLESIRCHSRPGPVLVLRKVTMAARCPGGCRVTGHRQLHCDQPPTRSESGAPVAGQIPGPHTLSQGPPQGGEGILTVSSGLPLAMSQNNFKINCPLDLTHRAKKLLQRDEATKKEISAF